MVIPTISSSNEADKGQDLGASRLVPQLGDDDDVVGVATICYEQVSGCRIDLLAMWQIATK